MPDENWQKIDALFHATIALQKSERNEFLRQECGDDVELFDEVRSLVASLEADKNFMEQSAISVGAKLLNSKNQRLGQRIGSHKIISELGQGGMGMVYLALRDDEEFQQRVAIKLARENFSSPTLLKKFKRERQIMAHLNHPHIARLLDGGTTENSTPYFVMEYVRGMNIVEYTVQKNLSVNERLNLFLKVCDAVSYAHKQGIIHRDIKPTNVLVTNDGEPKLLDFGIAKVLQENEQSTTNTRTGFHLFTPEYSSPEQARGENLSTATDIYSLGVLLYELLTTRHPFDFKNRSPLEIARIVCESEPIRPSSVVSETSKNIGKTREEVSGIQNPKSKIQNLDGDLDNIILMAMRKESSRRYQSVEDFADDIRRFLQNKPVKARPNSIFYLSSKFVQRNGKITAALAACLLLLFSLPVIYVTALRGNSAIRKDSAKRLTFNQSADNYAHFVSNDVLVFTRSDEKGKIFSIKTDGSEEKLISEKADRVVFSPDGKKIVFRNTDNYRLYLANNDFSDPVKITQGRAGRSAWFPDSNKILFSYNFSEDREKNTQPMYQDRDNVEIFSVNTDGANEKNLTNNKSFDSDGSVSPDGKKIVFASDRDGSFDIYTMNVDGSDIQRLTQNEFEDVKPSWSPDGKHIAFTSKRDGDEEIYIMNADGSNPRRLTNSLGNDYESSWSPDGKKVVFSAESDGNSEIYIIEIPPDFFK